MIDFALLFMWGGCALFGGFRMITASRYRRDAERLEAQANALFTLGKPLAASLLYGKAADTWGMASKEARGAGIVFLIAVGISLASLVIP